MSTASERLVRKKDYFRFWPVSAITQDLPVTPVIVPTFQQSTQALSTIYDSNNLVSTSGPLDEQDADQVI